MTKENMHIHSNYSWDSKLELEDIVETLIQNNISYGALTDHVEFNKEPLPYVLTKLKIRNQHIDNLNKKYDGKIKLLKGVEISSPHLYKSQVDALSELDLDFLMGSIHKTDKSAKTISEKKIAFYEYYQNVIAMVKEKQIDVIGHMDYIKRYYDKDYSDISQIIEILDIIKQNDIILEINTSAERRCGQNLFPSIDKIVLNKVRNDLVVIGTDAHRKNELVDNLEQAEYLIEELGLKPVIFQKRKKKKI